MRKSYYMDGRKFQIGNVSLFIVKKDYSYLCMWDDIKLAGKKHNVDPMSQSNGTLLLRVTEGDFVLCCSFALL